MVVETEKMDEKTRKTIQDIIDKDNDQFSDMMANHFFTRHEGQSTAERYA